MRRVSVMAVYGSKGWWHAVFWVAFYQRMRLPWRSFYWLCERPDPSLRPPQWECPLGHTSWIWARFWKRAIGVRFIPLIIRKSTWKRRERERGRVFCCRVLRLKTNSPLKWMRSALFHSQSAHLISLLFRAAPMKIFALIKICLV